MRLILISILLQCLTVVRYTLKTTLGLKLPLKIKSFCFLLLVVALLFFDFYICCHTIFYIVTCYTNLKYILSFILTHVLIICF